MLALHHKQCAGTSAAGRAGQPPALAAARLPRRASSSMQQQQRVQQRSQLCSAQAPDTESTSAPPQNVCGTCGVPLSEKESGCDGGGRVVGGLSVVPGFGWWPIKAYRPCPQLDKNGVEYVRKGQGLNDVMFGGASLGKEGGESYDRMREQRDRGIDIK